MELPFRDVRRMFMAQGDLPEVFHPVKIGLQPLRRPLFAFGLLLEIGWSMKPWRLEPIRFTEPTVLNVQHVLNLLRAGVLAKQFTAQDFVKGAVGERGLAGPFAI